MSIQTELNRLETAKANIKTAIEEKGVEVPIDTKIDGMADLINSIEAGSSVNLAQGTYTISTQIDGANKSVFNLTELTFKPTKIIITYIPSSRFVLSGANNYYFIGGTYENNATTALVGWSYGIQLDNTGVNGKIIVNDSGFEVKTGTDSKSKVPVGTYHYVVM